MTGIENREGPSQAPETSVVEGVNFNGESLMALERWLGECRWTDRSGQDYFQLVDSHNRVREALGMPRQEAHPDFKRPA